MFHSFLSIALLALTDLPAPVTLPEGLETHDLRSVVQSNDSWFVYENHSQTDQILFVRWDDIELVTAVRVRPQVQHLWAVPAGEADNISVEVLSLDAGGWHTSGALTLAELNSLEKDTCWVTHESSCSFAMWQLDGADPVAFVPSAEVVPQAVLEAGVGVIDEQDENAAPTHVPVIVPGDGLPPVYNGPPPITEKPLPPI